MRIDFTSDRWKSWGNEKLYLESQHEEKRGVQACVQEGLTIDNGQDHQGNLVQPSPGHSVWMDWKIGKKTAIFRGSSLALFKAQCKGILPSWPPYCEHWEPWQKKSITSWIRFLGRILFFPNRVFLSTAMLVLVLSVYLCGLNLRACLPVPHKCWH